MYGMALLLLCQRSQCSRHVMAMRAGAAGFECLSEDTNDVMGLLADVVLRPAMPQRKLEFFRSQVCLYTTM